MAFSATEALAAFGMGQQASVRKQQWELEQKLLDRKEETRGLVSTRVGTGDYQGAMGAAIEGGEFDLAGTLSKLDEGQRKQAMTEAQIMARAAEQLKAVPADQRPSAYQQIAPMLKQAGFSDDELAAADLSDAGLDVYVAFGKSVADVLNPPKPGEGFTLGPGAIRYGPDGKVVAQSPYDPVVQADGVIYSRPPNRGVVPPTASPTPKASGPFAVNGVPGDQETSGKRSAARNAAVGGVPNSFHLTGQASDRVPPPGMSMSAYHAELVRRNPDMAVINEGDHVHLEPRGSRQPKGGDLLAEARAAIAAGADPQKVRARLREMGGDDGGL